MIENEALEDCLKIKANIKFMPMQPGDVRATYANTNKLEKFINFRPNTSIEEGIRKFVEWYKEFYRKSSNNNLMTNLTKKQIINYHKKFNI